jgi:hypothetical protein
MPGWRRADGELGHRRPTPKNPYSFMATNQSLLPKEHGAYAELAFPLITGLALAAPSLPALSLGLAAVLLFLANEPLAVLLGARGKRLKDQLGERAKVRGSFLLGGATGLGMLGVWRGGAEIWPELAYPLAAGALLVPLVLLGKQKTIFGEFVVVTAFTTLLLPLAAASGADPQRALSATGVWWLSFGLGTLEVHAIKARLKKTAKGQWTRWGSPVAAGLVSMGAVLVALGQGGVPELAGPAAALLTPAVAIFALSLIRVHPKHLKRVGWTLVGANTVALVLLLLG